MYGLGLLPWQVPAGWELFINGVPVGLPRHLYGNVYDSVFVPTGRSSGISTTPWDPKAVAYAKTLIQKPVTPPEPVAPPRPTAHIDPIDALVEIPTEYIYPDQEAKVPPPREYVPPPMPGPTQERFIRPVTLEPAVLPTAGSAVPPVEGTGEVMVPHKPTEKKKKLGWLITAGAIAAVGYVLFKGN